MIYRRREALFVLPGLSGGPSQGQRSARLWGGGQMDAKGERGPVGTRQGASRAPSHPTSTMGSSPASHLSPCSGTP